MSPPAWTAVGTPSWGKYNIEAFVGVVLNTRNTNVAEACMKPIAHSNADTILVFDLCGRKTEMRISTATVEHFWEVPRRHKDLQVQVRNKLVYAGLNE